MIAHTIPDTNGNESCHFVDDESPVILLPVSKAFIERWNKADSFQKFLRREADRERALRMPQVSRNFDEDDLLSSEPPLVPSSDGVDLSVLSSGDELESDDMSIYSTKSDSILYPFAQSAVTPFPTNPLHRKRVERLKRRIEKLTRSGLRDMLSSDEDEKGKDAKKATEKTEDVKKTNSAPSKGKKVIEKMKGRSRRRAVTRNDFDIGVAITAEGWDPFGDEAELCL